MSYKHYLQLIGKDKLGEPTYGCTTETDVRESQVGARWRRGVDSNDLETSKCQRQDERLDEARSQFLIVIVQAHATWHDGEDADLIRSEWDRLT